MPADIYHWPNRDPLSIFEVNGRWMGQQSVNTLRGNSHGRGSGCSSCCTGLPHLLKIGTIGRCCWHGSSRGHDSITGGDGAHGSCVNSSNAFVHRSRCSGRRIRCAGLHNVVFSTPLGRFRVGSQRGPAEIRRLQPALVRRLAAAGHEGNVVRTLQRFERANIIKSQLRQCRTCSHDLQTVKIINYLVGNILDTPAQCTVKKSKWRRMAAARATRDVAPPTAEAGPGTHRPPLRRA